MCAECARQWRAFQPFVTIKYDEDNSKNKGGRFWADENGLFYYKKNYLQRMKCLICKI